MTQENWTLSQLATFDEILDVRSPGEYETDHIPGAINCPVLDDQQRAHIGRLHKQVSPFEARKQGAGLVARNIARHIESRFSKYRKDWRPLVYCWRGGARSSAMTHILNSVGWRATRLTGGYKTYRRIVINTIDRISPRLRFVVLCGPTGVGKSRLLESFQKRGAQVLDLETTANHRGSVLGEPVSGKQPTQRWFESLVCQQMDSFNSDEPVYVESESRKIGSVQVPEHLIESIRNGQCVRVDATLKQRVGFLLKEYAYFVEQPERFREALNKLKPYIGKALVEEWTEAFSRGFVADVVEQLIDKHYDPFYLSSIKKHFPNYERALCVELADMTQQSFDSSADRIMRQKRDRSGQFIA